MTADGEMRETGAECDCELPPARGPAAAAPLPASGAATPGRVPRRR